MQKRLYFMFREQKHKKMTKFNLNKRQDMAITQEEGDTLILQQVSRVEDGTVLVVADDTDIFVLLLYFWHQGSISCKVLMVSPIQGRSVLDINAAA